MIPTEAPASDTSFKSAPVRSSWGSQRPAIGLVRYPVALERLAYKRTRSGHPERTAIKNNQYIYYNFYNTSIFRT
ncbi:hypothetical protein CHELA1G11_21938 [Hyphomicrobiales bacterium]|nr:hypothetical protein CHELA1G11_21938 [Hyphomicrobiales bacterium]